MKKSRRVLSLLLVLVMLVGILPVMTYARTFTANDSRYKKEGELPETAKNVTYLSDLPFVESVNYTNTDHPDGITVRDIPWTSSSSTVWTIYLGDLDGTSDGNIVDGMAFEKGLGVMPRTPANGGNCWTTFDVSGLKCNNFHSVVGLTNGNGQKQTTNGVIFNVYGQYEVNGEFVLLESSGELTGVEIYEFFVDITGVLQLKLETALTVAVSSMNSAWGGACVYSNSYTPNAQINGDGKGNLVVLDEADQNPHSTYNYVNTLPAGGTYLELAAKNTAGAYVYGATGTAASTDVANITNTKDYDRWIGGYEANPSVNGNIDYAVGFKYVVELSPENKVGHTGYAIFDVSKLGGNRFYSVVGNRNVANSTGVYDSTTNTSSTKTQYGGIMFEVWGSYDTDKSYDTATYELLAQSEVIYNANTGEFNVDITGVKWLKLVNKSNTGTRSYCDGVFANACVYTADTFDIEYSNMALENDLGMKFAFKQNSTSFTSGHYAEITFNGTTEKVPFADWQSATIDGEAYYYVTYSGVAAKEMTDTFQVTIYDGGGNPVSNAFTDTVQDYCLRNLLKKYYALEPTDAKVNVDTLLCRLVVDVLNYGAAAQTYFTYKETDLANNVLIEKFAEMGGAAPDAYSGTATATGTAVKYYGTNLALESNIRLKFGFTGLTETMRAVVTFTDHRGNNKTVNIPYEEFETVKDFDGLVIAVDALVVADMRQDVTVKIYNGTGTTPVATVVDSVEGYLSRKAEIDQDAAMCDALMTMSDSAYAYFYADANPSERQSELLSSHQVLVTDIDNGKIVVADLDKADPFATKNLEWSYTNSKLAGYLSDAKVRMLGDKKVVLYTGSDGSVGMIDYSTKKVLWSYNLDDYYTDLVDADGNAARSGPHSIELLPNGDIVVASSGNGTWTNGRLTYFDMNGTTCSTSRMTSFELNGAHGVTWDPENNLLWVSGFLSIEAYKLNTSGTYATITKVSGKGADIPGKTGHDLMQDYSDLDILWITDNKNVYQFSKSQNAIISEYPNSTQLLNVINVKGIGSFSDGVVALVSSADSSDSKYGTNTLRTYWPLNDGSYELVEYTNTSYGFNKVRIFTTDYQ